MRPRYAAAVGAMSGFALLTTTVVILGATKGVTDDGFTIAALERADGFAHGLRAAAPLLGAVGFFTAVSAFGADTSAWLGASGGRAFGAALAELPAATVVWVLLGAFAATIALALTYALAVRRDVTC